MQTFCSALFDNPLAARQSMLQNRQRPQQQLAGGEGGGAARVVVSKIYI